MAIDIKKTSEDLKDFVSQYETSIFLGDIAALVHFISFENPTSSLSGLSSPLRQLYYVAALNLTSKIPDKNPLKPQYSEEDWQYIKKLLVEIEKGYEQFFYPKQGEEIDDEWKARRIVSMPTFLDYFNQGTLNYEEQILERVVEHFTPFNSQILNSFGIGVNDFIDIYNFIDSLPNKFLDKNINKKEGQQTWEEFVKEMSDKKIPPWEFQQHMPEHLSNGFKFMYDKGSMHRFKKQQLIDEFGFDKSIAFINAMISDRIESSFLYYTEQNPLFVKPLFVVGQNEYQFITAIQIIQSIYNSLLQFCISMSAVTERFYAHRGNTLEVKVESVFRRFFGKKVFVHKSFYTQDGSEQDLLFLIDGFAFIVEVKASKRSEPRRDPDKAYPLILSNFNDTIQKGYDQSYRVKSKFIKEEVLRIYLDQKLTKHVVDIRTKNYHDAFSIIVTLERFGQIQNNLDELLEIYNDDEFPWSVCIDDLESFLLVMKKKDRRASGLAEFLTIRQRLQGRLITSDELEVCGGFLTGHITKERTESEEIFGLSPDLSGIFDEIYHNEGLGFKNEKNMHIKTDKRYMILGGRK